MTICDYSGIAEDYENWCSGDNAYMTSAAFYLDFLADHKGIFVELGVGTGRIAIPLARRQDSKVYGIDSSAQMLEQCRQNECPNQNLTLIQDDFMCFLLPELADVVYMPFRTIGHILTKEALAVFFNNVRRNLKPGGLFIFDHYIFNKAWALRHNGVNIPMYDDGAVRITDYYKYDFKKGLMDCTIKRNGKKAVTFYFRWIYVDEINSLLAPCGFSLAALFGDFDKSPWDSNSPNQIWVLKNQ